MATGYVTNYGNDANDGLTWETAKKTFQGAKDAGLNPVYAKGWFDDAAMGYATVIGGIVSNGVNNNSIIADAFERFNGDTINFSNWNRIFSPYFPSTYGSLANCIFYNCGLIGFTKYNSRYHSDNGIGQFRSNLIYNSKNVYLNLYNRNYGNTIHNISDLLLLFGLNTTNNINFQKNIISTSVVEAYQSRMYDYSLYINSSFKFTGGLLGTDETTYTYPTGATDYDKLQNLRNRMASVYGGVASDYLIGCKYYSRNAPDGQEEVEPYASAYKDIFVDADNGNFYLKEDSIAAHMAYDGSYVGAKPVGQQIALSDFSLTNIDANGKVTNQEIDSLAQRLNVTDLLKVRKILSWTALGERAARNGQQINTESNLGLPISAGAAVLTALKTYMVINDVITLDNAAATSYNPWETFQAIDEGGGAGLGFSTSTNGQVQEVLIDKYDEKITVKSSKDNPALTGANTLTFYLHEQPKVNLDANGIAIAGNADATFDPATAVDFYMRYITLDVQIKANNLLAR